MRLEKYEIKSDKNQITFDFISEGIKGRILKRVIYSKVKLKGVKNLYNLGFGDLNIETNEIDDLVVTDNQDREKVLATVANTALIFTDHYPKSQILIKGSTDPRTRLYQMAIGKYLAELSAIFYIYGLTKIGWFPFQKNTEYSTFLIRRK